MRKGTCTEVSPSLPIVDNLPFQRENHHIYPHFKSVAEMSSRAQLSFFFSYKMPFPIDLEECPVFALRTALRARDSDRFSFSPRLPKRERWEMGNGTGSVFQLFQPGGGRERKTGLTIEKRKAVTGSKCRERAGEESLKLNSLTGNSPRSPSRP